MKNGSSRFRQLISLGLLAVLLASANAPAEAVIQSPPNDPYYPSQTNLVVLRVPQAWRTTCGARMRIALLGYAMEPRYNPDIDLNVVRQPVGPSTSHTSERYASVMVGTANNRFGIVGVAPQALVVEARVTRDARLVADEIVRALGQAERVGCRIAVIQFSEWLTLSEQFNTSGEWRRVYDAMAGFHSRGGLIFGGMPGGRRDPAQQQLIEHLILVTGLDPTDLTRPAVFSGTGPAVWFGAPGQNIVFSDKWGQVAINGAGPTFAAAQSAGVAALIWSANPNLRNVDIERIMIETAQRPAGSRMRDEIRGYGIPNAEAGIRAAQATLFLPPPNYNTIQKPPSKLDPLRF